MFSVTSLIFAGLIIYYCAHGCLADPQIIGGTDAPDGMYPYQVTLKDPSDGRHFCGGAIVSKKYIITAAHCLEGRQYPDIQIGVGNNLLQSQITYTADALIIHDNYNKAQHLNDIGLIKLSKDITFNETIKSIALMDDNKDFEGVSLKVSGWGRIIWAGGPIPVRLQHLNVTGYSQKSCAAIYPHNITDGHICTLESTGKGVCFGDSGGALTYGDKLVGIVSFGVPCGEGFPDVFTRVYYYRDWVNKYINAGCNQQLNILLGLFTTYLCIHSFL